MVTWFWRFWPHECNNRVRHGELLRLVAPAVLGGSVHFDGESLLLHRPDGTSERLTCTRCGR